MRRIARPTRSPAQVPLRRARARRPGGSACRPGTRPPARRRRSGRSGRARPGRGGRAAGPAVDPGRRDGGEEPAVEAGVTALHGPVAAVEVELEHHDERMAPRRGRCSRVSDIASAADRARARSGAQPARARAGGRAGRSAGGGAQQDGRDDHGCHRRHGEEAERGQRPGGPSSPPRPRPGRPPALPASPPAAASRRPASIGSAAGRSPARGPASSPPTCAALSIRAPSASKPKPMMRLRTTSPPIWLMIARPRPSSTGRWTALTTSRTPHRPKIAPDAPDARDPTRRAGSSPRSLPRR